MADWREDWGEAGRLKVLKSVLGGKNGGSEAGRGIPAIQPFIIGAVGIVELPGLPTLGGRAWVWSLTVILGKVIQRYQIVDLECAAVEMLRVLIWCEVLIICHFHDH